MASIRTGETTITIKGTVDIADDGPREGDGEIEIRIERTKEGGARVDMVIQGMDTDGWTEVATFTADIDWADLAPFLRTGIAMAGEDS